MTSPFDPVARGLRLSAIGFQMTVGLLAAAVAFAVLSGLGVVPSPILGYGSALLACVGSLVGFAGRLGCRSTPDEAATARTRIRLALALEACGWLNALGSIAAGITLAGVAPRLMSVPVLTFLLTVVLLAVARVMFLWYARGLADHIDEPTLARRATVSLVLFLTTAAGTAVGLSLLLAGRSTRWSAGADLAFAVAGGVAFGSVGVGVYGQVVYGRLLGGLQLAVRRYVTERPVVDS